MAVKTDFLKETLQAVTEYNQAYSTFMLEATQTAVNQSLALRESVDGLVASSLNQAQALSAKEQDMVLSNLEVANSQAKSAFERLSKLFK